MGAEDRHVEHTNIGLQRRTAAIVACVLLLPATPLRSQTPATAELTIKVVGARNAKGKVRVAIFRDAKGFPDVPADAWKENVADIDAKALTAETVFPGLPPGTYAVTVIHDENGDGKMDKNFLGMPKEGHAASNNPDPKRRAPRFEEARFTLSAPALTLETRLLY
jgi:uncharacterized protein (DUF2141 family)